MASLTKKKSRYWIAQFRDHNGTVRNRSTRIEHSGGTPQDRSERQTRAKDLAEFYERMARGQSVTESVLREGLIKTYETATNRRVYQPSIAKFFEDYLNDFRMLVANGEKSERSLVRYEGIIKRFLKFLGKERCSDYFDSLNTEDFTKFRDYRLQKVCPKTLRNDYKCLNVPLDEAVLHGKIPSNPLKIVKKPKASRKPRRLPFIFTDVRMILDYCQNPAFDIEGGGAVWDAITCAGFYTGLRLADICGLRWKDVDLAKGLIRLIPSKTEGYETEVLIPIHPRLQEALLKLPSSDDPSALIFPSQQPTTQSQVKNKDFSKISKRFMRVMKKAGVDSLPLIDPKTEKVFHRKSFHSFRHTVVTSLRKADIHKDTRKKLVGHLSDDVHSIYDHIDLDESRAAINALPRL